MILLLATRYRKYIAWLLFVAADLAFASSAEANEAGCHALYRPAAVFSTRLPAAVQRPDGPGFAPGPDGAKPAPRFSAVKRSAVPSPVRVSLGGPTQPEL